MSDPKLPDELGEASLRFVNLLVIHCSASKNGDSLLIGEPGQPHFMTPNEVIDTWHLKRGFHRSPEARKRFNADLSAIGYHFVIGLNGAIYTGRHLDEIGAHVYGYNRSSVGICMVGTDKFAQAQWEALKTVVSALQRKYEKVEDFRIVGHRDLSPDVDGDGIVEPWEWLKICPGFEVSKWLDNDMRPDPAHILDPEPDPAAAALKKAA